MPSLTDTASQIRRDILRMVHTCNSGHPGGSLGCADLLTALYFQVMKHNPKFNMEGNSFLIDYFPVKLSVADFLLVGFTVLAIALIASWIPARKAALQQFSLREE